MSEFPRQVAPAALTPAVFVFLVLLLPSTMATAQTDDKAVRRAEPAASVEGGQGDLYAVVVGISNYENPKIPPLRVSDKDAKDFAAFLRTQDKLFRKVHIELLVNDQATRGVVEKHLHYTLRRAGKDDTVVVFMSGHGQGDRAYPNDFFFLTYDSDPEYPASSAVNMTRQWFTTRLDSKRVLLIADACHAGGFADQDTKAVVRAAENFFRASQEANENRPRMSDDSEGRVLLLSSRADELSQEKPDLGNSVFTYYLLEGLKGAADTDKNGLVSLDELYNYVYEKTREATRWCQSPRMSARDRQGPFPLALCRTHPGPLPVTTARPSAPAQPSKPQRRSTPSRQPEPTHPSAPPRPSAAPQPAPEPTDEMARLRARAESGDSTALSELALVLMDQGMFRQARDNSLAAIEVANKARNDKDSAIFTLRLGNLYEYYGQFEAALDAYESARELQEKARDRFFLSNTLADIGNAKIRLIPPEETPEQAEKRLRDAEDNCRKAISLRREIGSPTAEILCKAALVHMEKPQFVSEPLSAGQRTSDLRAAAEYIGAAEQELTSSPRPNRNHKFLLDYVRARHLFLEGKHKESLDLFKALNGEARAARLLKYQFLASVGMGLCYEQLRELPQAEEAFQQAQTIAEDILDSLDPEGKRTFLSGEEVLGIKHVQAYEGLARVRQQMGHAAKDTELWRSALRASEGTKARAFADSLAKSQWSRTAIVDRQLVRKLDDIEDQLRTKNLQLAKSVAGKDNPNRIRGLETARTRLKSQRDAVAKAIKAQDRDFYTVRFASTIDLPDSQVRDNEWALVYEVTDTAVLGWLTHGSKMVNAAYVPLARRTLETQVDLVRKGFVRDVWAKIESREVTTVSEISRREWDYQGLLAAKKIYDSLVRGFVEQIPEKETLIIVTDDCLALIPFEILVTNASEGSIPRGQAPRPGEIKFLADRNPIVYYESIRALALARLRWKNAPHPTEKLLIMAHPRVECRSEEDVKADRREEMRRQLRVLAGSGRSAFKAGKNKALAAMSGEIQFLSRDSCSDQELSTALPETADLAKTVGTMFEGKAINIRSGGLNAPAGGLQGSYEGQRVDVYCGKEASLTRFRGEIQPRIGQYGKLLFATHAVSKDAAESAGPALMLSTDPPGFYYWLATQSMNADVVALIAPSTGLGPLLPGEGLMSVGRAFHQAGSRTVLMSLWNTEATASTRTAETFFAKLLQGKSKLEAFQEARHELRRVNNGEYAHPIFWAPFVMLGEPGSPSR
ncbi:MAG: CHAT domain-containing protein [Thermodesulfobacteriota bacterium]